MIYTPLTKKAAVIAYKAHMNQYDKSGMPYIFHPMHLAEAMPDELTTATALLHDVLEDTMITADDLANDGIPEEVIAALRLLTRKGGEDYFAYVKKIKGNSIACTVKIADLKHNSDASRLEVIDGRAKARLEKYRKALEILETKSLL